MFKSNFLEIEQSQILRFFSFFFLPNETTSTAKILLKNKSEILSEKGGTERKKLELQMHRGTEKLVYVVQATVSIEVTICYYHAVLVILVSFRESVA